MPSRPTTPISKKAQRSSDLDSEVTVPVPGQTEVSMSVWGKPSELGISLLSTNQCTFIYTGPQAFSWRPSTIRSQVGPGSRLEVVVILDCIWTLTRLDVIVNSHNSVTSHTQISDLFEGLILRSHPIGSKSKCNRVSQPPRSQEVVTLNHTWTLTPMPSNVEVPLISRSPTKLRAPWMFSHSEALFKNDCTSLTLTLMYILRIAQQELNPDRGALLKHEKRTQKILSDDGNVK